MKSVILVSSSVLALLFSIVFYLSIPVIEKHNMTNDVRYIGGEFSSADVVYVDHREAIKVVEGISTRWWGSSYGEWRRLETEEYTGRTYTKRVLRDRANTGSRFGVSRGSEEDKILQAQYDEVVAAYNKQGFFSRVWTWKVRRFR